MHAAKRLMLAIAASALVGVTPRAYATADPTPAGPDQAVKPDHPSDDASATHSHSKNVPGGMSEKTQQFRELMGKAQPRPQNDVGEDPLRDVADHMSEIVVDLKGLQTGEPVQQKQNEVVATLDKLIEMLEQQNKSGGAGSGANPTKPLASSVRAGGPGGQGEMIDPKQGDKQWASLPPKQREQILQSRTEGFPPGYEAILQSYYRRLSQEQVEPAAGGDTTSPSTPVPATK